MQFVMPVSRNDTRMSNPSKSPGQFLLKGATSLPKGYGIIDRLPVAGGGHPGRDHDRLADHGRALVL